VSVYVSAITQGLGIGQKLLEQLILRSERNNIWMLQAAIFPENLGSIKLHLNNNFRQLGIRKTLGKWMIFGAMLFLWKGAVKLSAYEATNKLMNKRQKTVGFAPSSLILTNCF
jgi:RimJ/RimL family protein N-acetyltransferase